MCLLILEKNFEGLDPSQYFLDPNGLDIYFEVQGAGELLAEIYYPRDFINGKSIFIHNNSLPESFTIKEVSSAPMANCDCSVVVATTYPHVDRSFDGNGMTLNDVQEDAVITVSFTNIYTAKGLDALMAAEGLAGEAFSVAYTDPADRVPDDGVDGSALDAAAPVGVPAFEAVDSVDAPAFEAGGTVGAAASEGLAAADTSTFEAVGTVAAPYPDALVPEEEPDDTFVYEDDLVSLILRAAISGLRPPQYPTGLEFLVIGIDAGTYAVLFDEIISYDQFIADQYVLKGLLPGVYTITQHGGAVAGLTLIAVPQSATVECVGPNPHMVIFDTIYIPSSDLAGFDGSLSSGGFPGAVF